MGGLTLSRIRVITELILPYIIVQYYKKVIIFKDKPLYNIKWI